MFHRYDNPHPPYPEEEWLSATSGQNKCYTVCGESYCGTVSADGKIYESLFWGENGVCGRAVDAGFPLQ